MESRHTPHIENAFSKNLPYIYDNNLSIKIFDYDTEDLDADVAVISESSLSPDSSFSPFLASAPCLAFTIIGLNCHFKTSNP